MVYTSVRLRDTWQLWQKSDDPSKDGWDTEALQKAAQNRLTEFLNSLTTGEPASTSTLSLATSFRSTALLPTADDATRQLLVDSERLQVAEFTAPDEPQFLDQTGPGLTTQLRSQFQSSFPNLKQSRWAVKLVGVRTMKNEAEVDFFTTFFGANESTRFESHGKIVTKWKRGSGIDDLRLSEIRLRKLEQSTTQNASPQFEDRTSEVLGATDSYGLQIQVGLHHWLGQSQDTRSEALLGTPGLAIADVNGDSLPDVYLCQEFGLPNKLYLRKPDGTLVDHSAEAGVDWLESSRGCLLVDLDNDGDRDLAVAIIGHVVIAANDGMGTFAISQVLATSEDTMSLAAADVDNDADLDIYVCCYQPNDVLGTKRSSSIAIPGAEFVYHDAATGAPNSLFLNESSGGKIEFSESTAAAGMDENNSRYSFAASFEDFDNDGDQDLYVANDYGPNNLYRNDLQDGRVTFVDIAKTANAQDRASGMSVTWGDPNRDGRMDVHVSNMFSSAGNRITGTSKFKPDANETLKKRLRRFARGNTLLQNNGERFVDVSQAAGITVGRWGLAVCGHQQRWVGRSIGGQRLHDDSRYRRLVIILLATGRVAFQNCQR